MITQIDQLKNNLRNKIKRKQYLEKMTYLFLDSVWSEKCIGYKIFLFLFIFVYDFDLKECLNCQDQERILLQIESR